MVYDEGGIEKKGITVRNTHSSFLTTATAFRPGPHSFLFERRNKNGETLMSKVENDN